MSSNIKNYFQIKADNAFFIWEIICHLNKSIVIGFRHYKLKKKKRKLEKSKDSKWQIWNKMKKKAPKMMKKILLLQIKKKSF